MLHLFNVLDRERFYTNMLDDKSNWRYYSAALVLIQRDFVKERPALVKDLIRLVKYWRKTFLPKKSAKRPPPSYLLELLTIHAWENANRPERFDVKIGFKAVIEALKNHQRLRVSWGDYYREDLIPSRYIHGVFKITVTTIKEPLFTFSRHELVFPFYLISISWPSG